MPPQQRQRRRDHAGAQHAQERDHALDRVGQLHADDGVGLQAEVAQPRSDRGDRAVGLRVGERRGAAVGEGFAVGRIGQRERVGTAHAGAAEQVVERRGGSPSERLRRGSRIIWLSSRCHQVSGK